jgi:hypothetical protein
MPYTQPETITKPAKTFEVHYAFPSSPMAITLGKGKSGTYYLTFRHIPQKETYHTAQAAHDAGIAAGRVPGFWSQKPY